MRPVLLAIAVLLLVGCQKQPSTSVIRTDSGPITSRLPELGSPRFVRWQSVEVTSDSFFSPPPIEHWYRLQGFAQLEQTKAEEFEKSYQWQKMPDGWKPGLVFGGVNPPTPNWNRSDAFTTFCKPSQFSGDLFFERSIGLVYFDIIVGK
jgi:hypothetical protein